MRNERSRSTSKSGQAIIFLMVVMVIGLFVVLWNFDLHNTISTKIRVGNAGDAAALSAARWQGITMNMVGELNLMQVAILLDDPTSQSNIEVCKDLMELRSRISLNGPLVGFIAAQAAGYMNLKEKDLDRIGSDNSGDLAERAAEFLASGDEGLYRGSVPGAYPGAWSEYGALLAALSQGDMLVTSANTSYFLFYDGSHTLLNPAFYNAIASSYWCWFKDNNRDLLTAYQDYGSWPPLPSVSERPSINSEYFSTHLKEVGTLLSVALSDAPAFDSSQGNDNSGNGQRLKNLLTSEETNPFMEPVDPDRLDINYDMMMNEYLGEITWHFYNEREWGVGGFMERYDELFDGITIKPEFDYTGGADAAVNVYLQPHNIAPGMHLDYDDIQWFAAAKPFGWLDVEGSDGDDDNRVAHYFGMVLPAFRASRLIRNDISTRTSGVTERGWDEHIYEHLPGYISGGLDSIEGHVCYYCQQLRRWEDPAIRIAGDTWLQEYHENPETYDHCVEYRGGGGGGGGGGSDWR